MRIGIDARFFGPQETGIGRYVERLLTHLARLDDHNTYVVFLRSSAWDHWESPNERWQKVRADFRWYSLAEQVGFPKVIQAAGVDLMHFPHFNVPLRYRAPFVVTIHDLTLNRYPTARASTLGPLLYWLKYLAYRTVISKAVKNAKAIITVSKYSRKDLIERFKVDESNVTVTYESVDPFPPPEDFQKLQVRGVKKPYLLHVGNAYPHKNLERLLNAWKLSKPGGQAQLVLVGRRDYFLQRLEEYAREKNIPDITWFGFASDRELTGLYQNAQAYFFPSLSEGFGLPGLEAMQAGTPLYAAEASCLPEIFGNAASYFDPNSTEAIRQSIDRALHDRLERQRLVAAGNERLTRFSWPAMARQTLTLYETLAQKEPQHSKR